MNEKRIQRILDAVPVFQGELAFDTLGIRSFVFPSMLMAARFVDFLGLEGNAWIEDDMDGSVPANFNVSVTVQVDTNR